jgi:hypothetical protein
MSIQVQYRRGSAAENDIFTGALAEITVDTTNKTIRVHDGATAGGSNIATVAYVDNSISSLSANSITDGTSNVRIVGTNGNVSVGINGNANVGVFTASGLIVTGSIEATNGFIGLDATAIANGSANVRTFENANVTVSAGGNANVLTVTGTGANISGTLNASGNANVGNLGATTVAATTLTGTLSTAAQTNITSVGTLTALAVTGNTSAGNFVGTLNGSGANVTNLNASNISSGTLDQARLANAAVTLGSTALTLGATVTTVEGLSSVTSTSFVGALTGAATTAGTVTTAAQPNITSVGTLSVLSVTGNTTSGNFVTTGSVDAGTLQTTGTAIIGGNLVVNGNTISVNIDDLHVQDPVIGLGRGPNNAPLTVNDGKARGTQLWYYNTSAATEASAFVGYNNQTGKLLAAANVSITNELVTVNSLGAFVAGDVEAVSVSASGNVTAGNVSSTTGAFTTVTGNGRALTSLTASNIDTGTLDQARLANAAVTLGSTALTLGATVTTVTGLSSVTSTTFVGALTGAATTAGTVTTAAQPNITSVGTMAAATITTLTTAAITKSGTNAVGNIGQSDNTFNTVFARASSASYADLAEIYLTDSDYPAGTVVIFGGEKEVTKSTEYADSRLAGVISTNPAFVMNDGADGQPIALQGRVPCSVVGNIVKGDLITTSDVPGVATRLDSNDWRPGTVLGKALENYNSSDPGVIEVVVGRV